MKLCAGRQLCNIKDCPHSIPHKCKGYYCYIPLRPTQLTPELRYYVKCKNIPIAKNN